MLTALTNALLRPWGHALAVILGPQYNHPHNYYWHFPYKNTNENNSDSYVRALTPVMAPEFATQIEIVGTVSKYALPGEMEPLIDLLSLAFSVRFKILFAIKFKFIDHLFILS